MYCKVVVPCQLDMQVLQRWHIFWQCPVRWPTFYQEACSFVVCLNFCVQCKVNVHCKLDMQVLQRWHIFPVRWPTFYQEACTVQRKFWRGKILTNHFSLKYWRNASFQQYSNQYNACYSFSRYYMTNFVFVRMCSF